MQKYWDRIKEEVAGAYEAWMKEEGIPIHETEAGVHDVTSLPRKPWARMGGSGTFIQMLGTIQDERGIYVAEIPGGGALNPERHMYDEAIFVLQGRGLTEVWHEGGDKVTFEWGEGSVFAPPMNTWHRLINGSREPALIMGVTTAPRMMNTVQDPDFIFNCEHQFTDRFGARADYFTPTDNRYQIGTSRYTLWETNFIPDVRAEGLEPNVRKGPGSQAVGYRMGRYFPNGHMSSWPVGRYQKAHYHGPGALLLGLGGKGFALLWPRELGPRPFKAGHGDQVVSVKWGPRSIYTPPRDWFHQHFNTSDKPARQVAIYGGLERPAMQSHSGGEDLRAQVSTREGGPLVDFEDEDPQVRGRFEEELKEDGIECTMPAVVYRD